MSEKREPQEWIRQWWFPILQFDHVYIAYLPNKDRDGKRFDVRPWETKALRLQGKLFGGATSWPSRGAYRLIDVEGRIRRGILLEETRMVTSFIAEEQFTEENIKAVTDFLQEFGRKSNQQSVAFAVDDGMHYILLKD